MLPQLRFDQPNSNYPHGLVQTLRQEKLAATRICKLPGFLLAGPASGNFTPLEAA